MSPTFPSRLFFSASYSYFFLCHLFFLIFFPFISPSLHLNFLFHFPLRPLIFSTPFSLPVVLVSLPFQLSFFSLFQSCFLLFLLYLTFLFVFSPFESILVLIYHFLALIFSSPFQISNSIFLFSIFLFCISFPLLPCPFLHLIILFCISPFSSRAPSSTPLFLPSLPRA